MNTLMNDTKKKTQATKMAQRTECNPDLAAPPDVGILAAGNCSSIYPFCLPNSESSQGGFCYSEQGYYCSDSHPRYNCGCDYYWPTPGAVCTSKIKKNCYYYNLEFDGLTERLTKAEKCLQISANATACSFGDCLLINGEACDCETRECLNSVIGYGIDCSNVGFTSISGSTCVSNSDWPFSALDWYWGDYTYPAHACSSYYDFGVYCHGRDFYYYCDCSGIDENLTGVAYCYSHDYDTEAVLSCRSAWYIVHFDFGKVSNIGRCYYTGRWSDNPAYYEVCFWLSDNECEFMSVDGKKCECQDIKFCGSVGSYGGYYSVDCSNIGLPELRGDTCGTDDISGIVPAINEMPVEGCSKLTPNRSAFPTATPTAHNLSDGTTPPDFMGEFITNSAAMINQPLKVPIWCVFLFISFWFNLW